MKYVCKEGFAVEEYDDDGWPTDKYMNIEAGEVYEVNDDWHRVAGGYDSIRLENNENGNWLELQQATIDQYFEPAEEAELTGTDMHGGIVRDEAGNVIDWGIVGPPGEVGRTEAEE